MQHVMMSLRGAFCGGLLAALLLLSAAPVRAATTTAGPAFDVEKATRAYLDRLTPEKKVRSNAYFEGKYWLQLWDFLYGAAVAWIFLRTKLSALIRDLAARMTRFTALQVFGYWAAYTLIAAALTFPLTVYEDFLREHHYGLATHGFGGWFGDFLKNQAVTVGLGGVLMMAFFAMIRRRGRNWPVAGSVIGSAFLILTIVIAPVFIDPLFNRYTLLEDPKVRDPILSLARANGVSAENVWQLDASRQTKRISANVSGVLGTMRIRLNDNLLNRCTLPEIEMVMGHEMGHYVLNHIYKLVFFLGVVMVVGMYLLRWAIERLLSRFGTQWGITGSGDPAVIPLALFLISAFIFVLTPVMNTAIRVQEVEADLFGLNASRQPDGFAEVSLKLAEYRKLEPGPVEEFLFYDHPSPATRIRTAMRWKAEHLPANVSSQ